MIKVNLGKKRKKSLLKSGGGAQGDLLAGLSVKGLIAAAVIFLIPPLVLEPFWKSEQEQYNKKIRQFKSEIKKIDAQMEENRWIEKQLELYQQQVKNLEKRSAQVESIIKGQTNPYKALESLARSMSKELWINELNLQDRKMVISGAANSYRSIGQFMKKANETPFFGRSLSLMDTKTFEDEELKKRVDSFEIEGLIEAFDLWTEQ